MGMIGRGISRDIAETEESVYFSNIISKDEIFNRSRLSTSNTVPFPYNIAIVIGCGGIGSWVGRLLGNIEKIQKLILIDPDIIEKSNLSRTPYKLSDINFPKSPALAREITDTNIFCEVYPFVDYFNEDITLPINEIIGTKDMGGKILVIDCRDDDFQDYGILKKLKRPFTVLRAAYDDMSVTLDLDPESRVVWGARGYSIQPSQILPSFMSALLVVSCAINYEFIKEHHPYMFKYPMTFNCLDILPLLFYSARTMVGAEMGDDLFKLVVDRWKDGDFETVKINEEETEKEK
jgi:hypothetical protein